MIVDSKNVRVFRSEEDNQNVCVAVLAATASTLPAAAVTLT
jgi:hypothetical protein